MWQRQTKCFWWFEFACNAFVLRKLYNRIARIKPYSQSNILLLTDINCFYLMSSFTVGRSAA